MIIQFKGGRKAPVQPEGTFECEVPKKRKNAAEPLKNLEDIIRVSRHFIAKGDVRANLLFILGINTGFRCGDLLKFRVGHLVDADGNYRDEVRVQEEKTGKVRTFYLNDAILNAADLYFEGRVTVDINDYLFPSRSTNENDALYQTIAESGRQTREGAGGPITVYSVERILKKAINEELGIAVHAGTHLMRKTFAYHCIMSAPDRTRAIEFLQRILGHSSPAITLAYAGITDEEVRQTYHALNLGAMRHIDPLAARPAIFPARTAGAADGDAQQA